MHFRFEGCRSLRPSCGIQTAICINVDSSYCKVDIQLYVAAMKRDDG